MSTLKVYEDGKAIDLDPSELLGSGGEVDVIGKDKYAYAIWHPSVPAKTRERLSRKIEYASTIKGVPDGFVKALSLLTDSQKGPVGFKMVKLSGRNYTLHQFTSSRLWPTFDVSQLTIVQLMKKIIEDTAQLNALGIIVVDGNPMNLMVEALKGSPLKNKFVDTPSYEYILPDGTVLAPSAVAAAYCAPRHFSWLTDVGPKNPFTSEDESWWQLLDFLYLYFRVQPHLLDPSLSNEEILKKVLAKEHVLSPKVDWPGVGIVLPPKSLTDEAMQAFAYYLDNLSVDGTHLTLLEHLNKLEKQLVVCPKHNYPAVYPSQRNECPHCAEDEERPDLVAKDVRIVFNELMKLPAGHRVVWAECINDRFVIFVDTGRNIDVHTIIAGPKITTISLTDAFSSETEFFVGQDLLGISENGMVKLYTYSGQLRHTVATSSYLGKAAFGLAKMPVWLIGSEMVQGDFVMNKLGYKNMMRLNKGLTWFRAYNSGGEYPNEVVGFQYQFNKYQWFNFKGKYEAISRVTMPDGYRMVSHEVIHDGQLFAIVREVTKDAIQSSWYIDLLESGKKNLKLPEPIVFKTSIGRPVLYTKKSLMLVSTEAGIANVNITTGQFSIIKGTEQVRSVDHVGVVDGFVYVASDAGSIFRLSAK